MTSKKLFVVAVSAFFVFAFALPVVAQSTTSTTTTQNPPATQTQSTTTTTSQDQAAPQSQTTETTHTTTKSKHHHQKTTQQTDSTTTTATPPPAQTHTESTTTTTQPQGQSQTTTTTTTPSPLRCKGYAKGNKAAGEQSRVSSCESVPSRWDRWGGIFLCRFTTNYETPFQSSENTAPFGGWTRRVHGRSVLTTAAAFPLRNSSLLVN